MDQIAEVKTKLDGLVKNYEEDWKSRREGIVKDTDSKIEEADKRIMAEVKAGQQKIDDYLEAIKKAGVVSIDGLAGSKEADQFSFGKMLYAIHSKDWSNAKLEEKIIQEAHAKAQDTNTGGAGGFLVPVELAMEKIIRPAYAASALRELGVTFMENLKGDIDIPESTTAPTLTFAAEGVAATEQAFAFALQPLRPKKANMLVKVSNTLLMQQGAFEAFILSEMQKGIKNGIDYYGIQGSGTSSQPLGIENVIGTNTTDIGSARMTHDDVATMIENIQEQDFLQDGKAKMLTRPKVIGGLRREKVKQYSADTSGQPIVVPLMSDQALQDYIGVQWRATTNVSKSGTLTKAIVGEFSEFLIGMWGSIRIKSSGEAGTSFATDQTWFVVFLHMDSRCTRPLALNIASNVETNF